MGPDIELSMSIRIALVQVSQNNGYWKISGFDED